MNKERKIIAVYGMEPMREGEEPDAWRVGFAGVTHIERMSETFGEYGIDWFRIWSGDILLASMNARYTATIIYDRQSQNTP